MALEQNMLLGTVGHLTRVVGRHLNRAVGHLSRTNVGHLAKTGTVGHLSRVVLKCPRVPNNMFCSSAMLCSSAQQHAKSV